jgi:tetratricopeptide (TPR) repeat protein
MKPLTGPPAARLAEARAFIDRGNPAAALPILLKLRRRSNHPDVALNLGRVHMALEDFPAAIACFREVLLAAPGVDFVLLSIARCHQKRDEMRAALDAVDEVLRRNPIHPRALVLKAELLHLQGRYDTARRLLDPLVERSGADPDVLFTHGRICRVLGDAAAAERSLTASITGMPAAMPAARRSRHHAECLYELAALHDSLGDHDRAWRTAAEANAKAPLPFDPDAHDAMVDRMIAAWTPEAFAAVPAAADADERPVFVLGMPRSGTSLVERILAAHPSIAGTGEQPTVHRLVRRLEPHEDRLPARIEQPAALSAAAIDAAAREGLARIGGLAPTAGRIVDKQPFNFLSMPMIARLFPGATIIHCRRDRLDVAVSCFFQSFMGAIWFANDLAHIDRFHRAYERLTDHWSRLMTSDPAGSGTRVLEVPYEDLTAEPEAWSRRLLEHVGMPWHEDCLRFQEGEHVTHSASADQVRRPMYRSSVQRWRRYEQHLAPIL